MEALLVDAGFYVATTKVVENLNNKQLSRVSS